MIWIILAAIFVLILWLKLQFIPRFLRYGVLLVLLGGWFAVACYLARIHYQMADVALEVLTIAPSDKLSSAQVAEAKQMVVSLRRQMWASPHVFLFGIRKEMDRFRLIFGFCVASYQWDPVDFEVWMRFCKSNTPDNLADMQYRLALFLNSPSPS